LSELGSDSTFLAAPDNPQLCLARLWEQGWAMVRVRLA
jgi:hypothetical protein